VAVDAVPDNEAVIVPAEKLPEPSLKTIVEAVLFAVADEYIVYAVYPVLFPFLLVFH
jgi:hypothetical protein